jgi:retron-type reverse transcriptase
MAQGIDVNLYQLQLIDEDELFSRMFSPNTLEWVFRDRFKNSSAKGIDRLNGFQFVARSALELERVSDKCLDGSFRFAPFLEKLKIKGRDKFPRVIGIPIIRDRIVLYQLQKYLAAIYPERVPKNVASTYVREIAEAILSKKSARTWVCCTDIKTFYDDIDPQRLLELLSKRVKSSNALRLIGHALQTPTVPKNTSRKTHSKYKPESGVPQGLAISNILASIYMEDVDSSMSKIPGLTYYRYVDDVLMYGAKAKVNKSYISLKGRLQRRGLSLHGIRSGKTQIASLNESFSYLGYLFKWPHITVRRSTVERFLQSIAAKVSDFKHNKSKRLEKFKYLDEQRLIEIFYLELNEKIAGAISLNKRYGWIAYFNQITDQKLLHEMDVAIFRMLDRVPELAIYASASLKRLSRAYFEIRFNPRGGYVRDYDVISTTSQKLNFLLSRGRVDPNVPLTNEQIDERYENYVHMTLARMHEDEGEIYQ